MIIFWLGLQVMKHTITIYCRFLVIWMRLTWASRDTNLWRGNINKQFGTYYFLWRSNPKSIKVKAIKDYPNPQNKKELKSFLCLVSWVRKFIPDLATHPVYLGSYHVIISERSVLLASSLYFTILIHTVYFCLIQFHPILKALLHPKEPLALGDINIKSNVDGVWGGTQLGIINENCSWAKVAQHWF